MKYDLIRSNFLYRTWEDFPHSIRLIVKLDRQVREKELREAVTVAAERYPYLCVRMVRKGEDYQFLHNDLPVPLIYGEEPVCLGSPEANGHYIAVSFRDDRIIFDAYHNLCDGQGIIPWVKTVLYLYLVRTVDAGLSSQGINLPGEDFLPNEVGDPYEGLEIPEDLTPLYSLPPVSPFVPDTRYAKRPGRAVYHVQAEGSRLIEFCRHNDGSPIVLTTYFVKEMIRQLFPDREGLPICIAIPHSLREILQTKNNYHDQLVPVILRYDERTDQLPMDRQFTVGRGSIFLQCDPDNVLSQIRSNIAFAEKINQLPTVEERRAAAREAAAQFIRYPETCCISYPGKISWGSLSPYIREAYLHTSVLGAPIMVIVFALEDNFFFTFHQRDDTAVFAETFAAMLRENGISAEVKGRLEDKLCQVFIP